jgi:hypothetical protein
MKARGQEWAIYALAAKPDKAWVRERPVENGGVPDPNVALVTDDPRVGRIYRWGGGSYRAQCVAVVLYAGVEDSLLLQDWTGYPVDSCGGRRRARRCRGDPEQGARRGDPVKRSLNGGQTRPLTPAGWQALARLARSPVAYYRVNPGVRDRLERADGGEPWVTTCMVGTTRCLVTTSAGEAKLATLDGTCPTCEPRTDGQPRGMHYASGRGWETCPTCEGTTRKIPDGSFGGLGGSR